MKNIAIVSGEPFNVKVFRYSYTKMNEVVYSNMVLYKVNDNVFLSEYKKDAYNRKEDDLFAIILKVKNVFVKREIMSRWMIENTPKIIENANETALNYIEKINDLVKEVKHVQLLHVKVFDALGLDTKSLLKVREERARLQEAKEAEAKIKQKQDQLKAEEEEKARLKRVKQDFLDDKFIDADDFLTLCKQDGIDIHIRTKGTFIKYVTKVKISGSLCQNCPKNKKPDYKGCFKAIAEYKQYLIKSE